MRFSPSFLAFAALVAGAVGASAVAACSETTGVTGVPPITGIVLRAESLTAGKGCGRGATQVYRYAAVVYGRNATDGTYSVPQAANVFDCYVDGTFTQLYPTGNVYEYRVDVFLYNYDAYLAQKAIVDNASAPEPPLPTDAVPNPVPPALAVKDALEASSPTWTTTCSASQYQDVSTLAVCAPLLTGRGGLGNPLPDGGDAAPPPASIKVPLGTFAGPEGGTYACDFDFETVRIRPRVGSTIGPATDVRCSAMAAEGGFAPVVYELTPAIAPAKYEIDIGLVRGNGSVLGQTVCRAETNAGTTATATCDPVP